MTYYDLAEQKRIEVEYRKISSATSHFAESQMTVVQLVDCTDNPLVCMLLLDDFSDVEACGQNRSEPSGLARCNNQRGHPLQLHAHGQSDDIKLFADSISAAVALWRDSIACDPMTSLVVFYISRIDD